MKTIDFWCSNCGKHTEFKKMTVSGIMELFKSGYRAVGDVIYCPDCVRTWDKRNGSPFYVCYKDSEGMFVRWCDYKFTISRKKVHI